MPRTSLTLTLCAVIALGAGAAGSWLTQTQSGVAVVDLDRVARELGRDVQMTNDLKANQNSVANQLATVEKNAIEKLNEMKADLGQDAAEDKKVEFAKTAQATQLQFNNLQKKAVAAIGQRRDTLVAAFRAEARPATEKVAKAHGASAVMTRNEAFLFSFDNTIDITDEVIAEMKANPAKPATPAAATASTATAGAGPVRQASATTTKPASKARPMAPKKNE
jgi:Skp family chaperone for outer membrane proteins